jgi:hypothetical protein
MSPKRAKERTDNELARCCCAKTESALPPYTGAKILTAEESRANDRTDKLEPRFAKARTVQ